MSADRFRSRTFGDLLDEIALAFPDQLFGVDSLGDRAHYGEMAEQTDRIAGWLASKGVKNGSRVALVMPNRLDWIRIALGAHKLGASLVAISTFSTAREIEHELKDAGPELIISVERVRANDFRRSFADVDKSAPGMHALFFWEDWCTQARLAHPLLASSPSRASAPAFILFTSGSSAAAKGVLLNHADAIENGFNIGERMHLTAADRVYLAVPLFWSFGSVNALPALMTHRGSFVFHESFEPGAALDLIERERCTVFYGMVNMARAMVEDPSFSPQRTTSLRTGLSIGLPDEFAYMAARLNVKEICSVYGMTETYGNCCVTDAGMPDALRFQCSGPALPGNEIRVVDDRDVLVASGAPGRIEVRGYTARYTNPSLNDDAYTKDGFFRTGDVGYLDAAGMIHFLARDNEMIKTGGINVSPSEVEQILRLHESIAQAYVVGVPDSIRGEVVFAYVVAAGDSLDTDALVIHCRKYLARYKVPLEFCRLTKDEIPLTPTGKVQRRRLRELARERSASPRPERKPNAPLHDLV